MNLLPVILWLENGCNTQDAVAELRLYQKRIDDERHHEIVRVTKLDKELEIERIRLAACGVVAMANTPESAKKARDMHPDYMSASCMDVAKAVDREMAYRNTLEVLRAKLMIADKSNSLVDYLLKHIDAVLTPNIKEPE